MLEIILFILADKALMKAPVQQALHTRIDFALQRAMQKFVKLSPLSRRKTSSQRLKPPALLLRRKDFLAYQ